MSNYKIRVEEKRDNLTVEELVRESFWNVYRPGCTEHFVLHHLRDEDDFIPELAFVMEVDGKIIGQNVFVKAQIKKDDGTAFPILTMGPICISNEYKRKGYGKILLDHSLEKAAAMGFGAVCFEGNIDFYGKSGFDYASRFGIRYHGLPEGMDDGFINEKETRQTAESRAENEVSLDQTYADFFLCKELKAGYLDGMSGEYATPKPYFVAEENPEDFEKFELEFNKRKPLEKQKLPGQLM
ncbi:MAG: N-acetyltransferase [Treponema sp.]|nr:N-acetyltransferase [Candidatus Treponema equi]